MSRGDQGRPSIITVVKKRLLKPPDEDGQIILFKVGGQDGRRIDDFGPLIVAHQPYFFHPGVALKFFLLHSLPVRRKETLFVDSDRLNLAVNLPPPRFGEATRMVDLISHPGPLLDLPNPSPKFWEEKFKVIDRHIERLSPADYPELSSCWKRFQAVIRPLFQRPLLKETLASAFLGYSGLPQNFVFLSDLLRGEEFKNFFLEIRRCGREFAAAFNLALERYRAEFKFRFRNFPFPPLRPGELPFWRLEAGKRLPLFEKDIPPGDYFHDTILPRASALTLFLRLQRRAVLIHGVGGANYEWIQDRLLERFFLVEPPPYLVVSGTFWAGRFAGRDFPYFFYPPERVRERLDFVLKASCLTTDGRRTPLADTTPLPIQ